MGTRLIETVFTHIVNQFVLNEPFLYPLETSQNRKVF